MSDWLGPQCSAVTASLAAALADGFQLVSQSHDPLELTAVVFSRSNPLVAVCGVAAAAVLLCFVWSLPTNNYSHVDRLWSLLPGVYVALMARGALGTLLLEARVPNPRPLVQLLLVLLWCARLTFNFARKGGYNLKEEDYRWKVIQKWPLLRLAPVWLLFNLLFICCFQHALLLLISAPASYVAVAPGLGAVAPWGTVDWLASVLFLAFWAGEALADQQQWVFQKEKYRRKVAGLPLEGDFAAGFLTQGLFSFSRHPNFFCEQATWWSFYLFSVASSSCLMNACIAGPVLLTMLFDGSTRLTEHISSQKYPLYAAYQRSTSRLLPWFPSRRPLKVE